jgi:hypothetical protein
MELNDDVLFEGACGLYRRVNLEAWGDVSKLVSFDSDLKLPRTQTIVFTGVSARMRRITFRLDVSFQFHVASINRD